MSIRKSTVQTRGFIRRTQRHSERAQRAALGACDMVFVDGQPEVERADFIQALRPGDTVAVQWLYLLAKPRMTTRDQPRRDLLDTLQAIEAQGAVVHEAATGRKSSVQSERDAMLIDAIDMLSQSGKGQPSKRARAHGKKGGRPKKPLPDDKTLERCRAAWFSLEYRTNSDAAATFPEGFTAKDAWQLWGATGRKPGR